MSREQIIKRGLYFSIIEGAFRTKVAQDHPEAVRRDWVSADKKSSGVKYEREVNALFGFIKDIQFHDGEYGMSINVMLDENENGESPIISMGTSSREGEDLMKKLPNLDLTKEVRLRPFNFTGSDSEEVRGMEVMQQDDAGNFTVKIKNYFRDTEKKENINGYPTPDADTSSSDDWKLFFLQARKFLINYTKENIIPKLGATRSTTEEGVKPRVLGDDPSKDIDDAFDSAFPDKPEEDQPPF